MQNRHKNNDFYTQKLSINDLLALLIGKKTNQMCKEVYQQNSRTQGNNRFIYK